jgi:predicted transcriptional regulator
MNFNIVVQYIEHNFGDEIITRDWSKSDQLPLFLRKGYRYLEIELLGVTLLLMDCSKKHQVALEGIEKHIVQLRDHIDSKVKVVLIFEDSSNYLRISLINKGISFIIPGKQIYIPVLGVAFSERQLVRFSDKNKKNYNKMKPTTQALFLELMVTNDFSRTMEEISGVLGVTKMSISRAFTELLRLGLISEAQQKSRNKYQFTEELSEIWNRAEKHFSNSKLREVYVKRDSISEKMWEKLVLSGESALSEYSMLGLPSNEIYGITSKNLQKANVHPTIVPMKDSDTCIVELWKHEIPKINGIVHPLGLAVLLRSDVDERIHSELSGLITHYKWKES